MMIPVNEIFATIQGEAAFTGAPSTFIRIQGCGVGCPWCDTKHTWALDASMRVPFEEVVAKDHKATPAYAEVTAEQLVDHCRPGPSHVVITGGEPCQFDLNELTTRLLQDGKTVQIETSGTQPIRCHADTWVTVSPKLYMPGGFAVLDGALMRANEIKMPVGKMADVEQLAHVLHRARPGIVAWLQPLSMSPKATRLCMEQATARGWRVSVQVHKFLGVR